MKFDSPLIFLGLACALVSACSPKPLPNGPSRIYSASCGSSASISLDVSVYRHKFYDELGGGVGWGLFYHPSPVVSVPLYDNGFSSEDNHGSPGPYVSWHFDGRSFSGPYPSSTYAPLPAQEDASIEKVFDADAVIGKLSAADNPPFMNIFLNPEAVPQDKFALIANCLSTNRVSIDNALSELAARIPSPRGQSNLDLKLGGIVYGLPPYRDPNYLRAVAKTRGSVVIPDRGFFTLYPGQSAVGSIGNYRIRASLDDSGNTNLEANGVEVRETSSSRKSLADKGKTNVSGITRGGGSWTIDGGSCVIDSSRCGKSITTVSRNEDLSYTYRVSVKLWDGSYRY